MTEYIERAAVHELVKSIPHYQMFNYDRTESRRGISPDDVDFGVDKIPAADVAEVVRCGECRHAEDSLVLWCTEHEQAVSRLDFCSHGARMNKEDEHEVG